MGASMSKVMAKIFGTKEMRLLMLGLDAAGKTSTRHSRFAAQAPLAIARADRSALQPFSTSSSSAKT